MKELVERLEAMLAKASARPWAYKPQEFDDWGYIRGPADDDGRQWIIATARAGGTQNLDEHRANGTDPYEPNGRLIVESVNALPDLLARIKALTAALVEAQGALQAMVDWNIKRGPFDEPLGESEQEPEVNLARQALATITKTLEADRHE